MQLFSGLLNILSPMRGSSNRAPIESGSPSSDDDDQTEFRQVVNPKYTVEQHSPKKKSLAASIKSGPTRRVSIDKQSEQVIDSLLPVGHLLSNIVVVPVGEELVVARRRSQ